LLVEATAAEGEDPMTGRPRSRARRFRWTRIFTFVAGTVIAIIAISAMAFAASEHGNNHKAANRRLCGRAYKLQKPIAPQFAFHDRGSKGVRGLAFCGNGSFLAAADANGHVYLWSMITHRTAWTLTEPRGRAVSAVAYRPRTSTVATGDASGSVYLWRPGRGRPRRLADPASKGIRALAFSPGGTLLAVADGNGRTYIWTMRAIRLVAVLHDPGTKGVTTAAFAADGKTIATGDGNGSAYEWALGAADKPRLLASVRDAGSRGVRAVAFRPGAKTRTVAIADGDGRDYLWTPGKKLVPVLADPASNGINSERFTPNGADLVTGDADGRLYFWALPIDRVVEFLPAQRARGIRAAAFSLDGRRVAAGTADGTIYVADSSRIGISISFSVRQGT
jgi:WD40 repeat protein